MRSGGGGGGVGPADLIPILSIVLIWCGAVPIQCTASTSSSSSHRRRHRRVFCLLNNLACTISDASAVNSASRDDGSKIYLKFCTKDFCKGKICYCCQLTSQPGHVTCYYTWDDCKAMGPACNPKCPQLEIKDRPTNATL